MGDHTDTTALYYCTLLLYCSVLYYCNGITFPKHIHAFVRRAPRNPHVRSDLRYLATIPNPIHVFQLGLVSARVSNQHRYA